MIIIIGFSGLAWVNRNAIVYYFKAAKDKSLEIGRDIFNKNVTLPTPTPVSTADWQTFNNEKYRYKVEYPNNWVYNQWHAAIYSTSETYQETIGFGQGPRNDSEMVGDIRISTYAQDLDATIEDVKDQTTSLPTGPLLLLEEINVKIGGVNFRKLTFTRMIPEPPSYNPDDRLIFYITSDSKFSHAISYGPRPVYRAIDEEIIASLELY